MGLSPSRSQRGRDSARLLAELGRQVLQPLHNNATDRVPGNDGQGVCALRLCSSEDAVVLLREIFGKTLRLQRLAVAQVQRDDRLGWPFRP